MRAAWWLAWDTANKQFVATVQSPFGAAETLALPYAQSDSSPALRPIRGFICAGIPANCNGSRKHAQARAAGRGSARDGV